MPFSASVHAKAIELIRLAVEMTTAAGSGHPTSAASLAHLVTVLMYGHMRYDPHHPEDPRADRLVLSEGHACPIIYAAGADLGLPITRGGQRRPMTRDDALQLRAIDSAIDGHPNPAEGFPFFPAATGSLGQGLSVSAGLALAARLDGLPRRVFCLIGDGESREGQIWEAVDFLVDHYVTAVCPIFNCNGHGQSDAVSRQQRPEVTAAKLRAAGFVVREIDGHDPEQIRDALKQHTAHAESPDCRPLAIVARTVKGWGFTDVLGSDVHGKPVPQADLDRAMTALDETARKVGARWTDRDLKIPAVPSVSPPEARPAGKPPSFTEALRRFGQEKVLQSKKMAPRKAFGLALRALGHADPRVVALDADVKNSTYSEEFADDPALKDRFFECRIAEQNMVSCAAGLASGGKLPFASTFGKFLTRGYDQVELAFISRLPLKLVGSHVGISPASDGPSQMALPDVAYFHAWTRVKGDGKPFFYLLNPSDARSAYVLTVAMAEHDGPCYLRAFRPDVPFLYGDDADIHLGGHGVLARGDDLLIVATGYMVHEALRALERLKKEKVKATLVDLYSLPFEAEAIVSLARQSGGRVLTLEDNFGNGFGTAVEATLAEAGGDFLVRQRYVRHIPKSGRSPEDVLRYLGLSADDIVQAALELTGSAAEHAR